MLKLEVKIAMSYILYICACIYIYTYCIHIQYIYRIITVITIPTGSIDNANIEG